MSDEKAVNLTKKSEVKVHGGKVIQYEHLSISTKTKMVFSVFLPSISSREKVPGIYYLSGLTCTDKNFITKACPYAAANAYGVAIIAPDTSPRDADINGEDDSWDFGTGAGFYVDATEEKWKTNYNMYTYITQELPSLVEKKLPITSKKSILGHSMGGHGALICYLKNPGMYESCSAFAPICNPIQCPWGQKAFTGYLGSNKHKWEGYDATCLVGNYAGAKREILIDQGTKDGFLEKKQLLPNNFVDACKAANFPVKLRMQKDYDHSYFFIHTFIEDHIKHHAEAMGCTDKRLFHSMVSSSTQTGKHDAYKFVSEISLPSPQQRIFNGVSVPLVLKWIKQNPKISEVVEWITKNQAWIEEKLIKHGGILFRDFPLSTATSFNQFVCSFQGWEDLSYSKSLSYAVRTNLEGRVCTTNDGKNGGLVFHHEQAQTPYWPSKVFFFCQSPAEEGGGTGICPSDIVLQTLEDKFPEFIKQCSEKGVKYTAYLTPDPDPSIGAGRGWKGFFSRETKEEAEERMKSLNYTWEWLTGSTGEKNLLKFTSPQLTAVSVVPGSTKRVFFNQLIATIQNANEWSKRMCSNTQNNESKDKEPTIQDGNESGNKRKITDLDENPKKRKKIDLDRFVTFGDGSSLDSEALLFAKQLSNDYAIELNWQKGDVALLDNYSVMHARRLWSGNKPRIVLASLVSM